jgi:hypothetical protein
MWGNNQENRSPLRCARCGGSGSAAGVGYSRGLGFFGMTMIMRRTGAEAVVREDREDLKDAEGLEQEQEAAEDLNRVISSWISTTAAAAVVAILIIREIKMCRGIT